MLKNVQNVEKTQKKFLKKFQNFFSSDFLNFFSGNEISDPEKLPKQKNHIGFDFAEQLAKNRKTRVFFEN